MKNSGQSYRKAEQDLAGEIISVDNSGSCVSDFYFVMKSEVPRTCLKKKIFVPDQGEDRHQLLRILVRFEDLMCGFNADMGRKDFFEIGSNKGIGYQDDSGSL